VPVDEPAWWYGAGEPGLLRRLLDPVSEIYAAVVERRFRSAAPYRAEVPVICVGNFTAGGTGKTPLARFLIAEIAGRGVTPVGLTRGYGGSLPGPAWVDTARHTAREVGDEPLLLSRDARVMVARDRKAGLAAIAADGEAGAVIMDDGLQNPGVVKDLAIAVVDATRGFGNGRVIPAGPLRARIEFQLGLVDCIVVMGAAPSTDEPSVLERLKAQFQGPVLSGRTEPADDGAVAVEGKTVLAYAGIANPERFFGTVEDFRPQTLLRRAFRDHHPFTEAEAESLLAEAGAAGATLLTTEKDLARLAGTAGRCGELRHASTALPIRVAFDERDLVRLRSLLDGVLNRGRE